MFMLKNINTLYKIIYLPIFITLTFWQGRELTAGPIKEIHWEKIIWQKENNETTHYECITTVDDNNKAFSDQQQFHQNQLHRNTHEEVSPKHYSDFHEKKEVELLDFIESIFAEKDDESHMIESNDNSILSFYLLPLLKGQKRFILENNCMLEELRIAIKTFTKNKRIIHHTLQLPSLDLIMKTESQDKNYSLSIQITTHRDSSNHTIEIKPTFKFTGDDEICTFRFLSKNMKEYIKPQLGNDTPPSTFDDLWEEAKDMLNSHQPTTKPDLNQYEKTEKCRRISFDSEYQPTPNNIALPFIDE